jgi:hypothetical protein
MRNSKERARAPTTTLQERMKVQSSKASGKVTRERAWVSTTTSLTERYSKESSKRTWLVVME